MRISRFPNTEKAPVFKNIVFALKLVRKADKRLFIGHLLDYTLYGIFNMYIQNILFLKILLSILDGDAQFSTYAATLAAFFVLSVVLLGTGAIFRYMHQVSSKRVLKELNNIIFQKAVTLDIAKYEDAAFYDKYQRATNVLSNGYFDLVCYDVANIVSGVLSLIFVIATVTVIDPRYLVFLLPVLFVFGVEMVRSRKLYKRDIEMTTNNRIKAYIQRTVFLKDYAKDMRTSNIFAVLMQRFKAAIDGNIVILRKYGPVLFLYSMVCTLFSDIIPVVGTYAFAGYQFVYTESLTVSDFSVVLSSINSVREAAMGIARSFDELTQMALYFQNFKEFLECENEVRNGDRKAPPFESLEFKDVSFRYPSAKENALSHVSFRIDKGETTALVGINGAGKSTLVKLLLRFYDPTDGEILYNGVNLKEYELTSLRDVFACVFQDYINFALSVNENVLCHECGENEKALAQRALEQSGIWEKICTLPDGADTVLTREFEKDGIGLSGGESQKIATARLFAKDFDFAVLDEPSSALDPIAEYKMYENLVKATKDKTVLYISHRLSSAVLSDKIIVLDGGRVLESGTHAELLASGGEYSKMFTLQASNYKQQKEAVS